MMLKKKKSAQLLLGHSLLKMEGEIMHIALVLHTCKHYCESDSKPSSQNGS